MKYQKKPIVVEASCPICFGKLRVVPIRGNEPRGVVEWIELRHDHHLGSLIGLALGGKKKRKEKTCK